VVHARDHRKVEGLRKGSAVVAQVQDTCLCRIA
jgi:hypothetical protein